MSHLFLFTKVLIHLEVNQNLKKNKEIDFPM